MNIGKSIWNIRNERKMTQEEFGRLFHVTRQTVSNWENEKSYPDLQTLIAISDTFDISLDKLLKEDQQMVKKMNREIHFSQNFKKTAARILSGIGIAVLVGAIGWGIVWNSTKNSLESGFRDGAAANGFSFDSDSGCYLKPVGADTCYVLPNQAMPGYLDFALHFHAATLDYYTVEEGQNIQIRWSEPGSEGEIHHTISYLDENGDLEHTLSERQEEELCLESPRISAILREGEAIWRDVYA